MKKLLSWITFTCIFCLCGMEFWTSAPWQNQSDSAALAVRSAQEQTKKEKKQPETLDYQQIISIQNADQ